MIPALNSSQFSQKHIDAISNVHSSFFLQLPNYKVANFQDDPILVEVTTNKSEWETLVRKRYFGLKGKEASQATIHRIYVPHITNTLEKA